ncbi:MAG TPA: endonuclease/exonuclease/phosphatase family protein [Candidatus Babeliales bacterium]|nr:endonuclease/exonuclease/phosphatase family protein [Candidatus Babeliales bacterium]
MLQPQPQLLWNALAQNQRDRQQQRPTTYNKTALKYLFGQQISTLNQQVPPLNQHLPYHQPTKNRLRLITYNVHDFKDPLGQPSFWQIYDTLATVNPDVILLQEANYDDIFLHGQLRRRFQKLGYVAASFVGGSRPGSHFGNCIISKYHFACHPYKRNFQADQQQAQQRALVKIELDLSAWRQPNLAIYNTHLEVTNAAQRLAEAQELSQLIHHYDQHKNVIVGADFNENGSGQALQFLGRQQLRDTFTQAGLPLPYFTHWSGQTLDYLLLKSAHRAAAPRVTGSYVYYTAASDHLPVITDLAF